MASTEFRTVLLDSFQQQDEYLTARGTASFDTNVIDAGVAIQEWHMSFEKAHDYNVLALSVSVAKVQNSGNQVEVEAKLLLEDESQHYAKYGSMKALVIAVCDGG